MCCINELLEVMSPTENVRLCVVFTEYFVSNATLESCYSYIPTSVIKSSVDLFVPLIACLAALSFTEGMFMARFKIALVNPLLKKKRSWSLCVRQLSTKIGSTYNFEDQRVKCYCAHRIVAELQPVPVCLPTWLLDWTNTSNEQCLH